jgi:hypothetical protein
VKSHDDDFITGIRLGSSYQHNSLQGQCIYTHTCSNGSNVKDFQSHD